MTYQELKTKHQEEVNALPLYFAFGEKQWKELLEKLGLTDENCKEHLCSYGQAIVKKEDAPMIHETFVRHRKEVSDAMKDVNFFKEAAVYEMCNHEYGINWQADYDVINALGFDVRYSDGKELDECGMSEEQKSAYLLARKEYFKLADEKKWF